MRKIYFDSPPPPFVQLHNTHMMNPFDEEIVLERRENEEEAPSVAFRTGPHLFLIGNLPPPLAHEVRPCMIWFNEDVARAKAFVLSIRGTTGYPALRIVDFFVIKYLKTHRLHLEDGDVYTDYRRNLMCYGKKIFDVFKRRNFTVVRFEDIEYATSVGQLIFFKWYLERGLHLVLQKSKRNVLDAMKDEEKKGRCPIAKRSSSDPVTPGFHMSEKVKVVF